MSPTQHSVRSKHHVIAFPIYAATAACSSSSLRHPAAPMAVPNARHEPPPPLPPPTHIPKLSTGDDPGWQWANLPHASDRGLPSFASVKPGSSLLGASGALYRRPGLDYDQLDPLCAPSRGSNVPCDRTASSMSDDRRVNGDIDAPVVRPPPNAELKGERDLRQRAIEQSSQSYDKQLVNRIGGPNTPKRQSISYSPTSVQENGTVASNDADRRSSCVWSSNVPQRRLLSVDSISTPRLPPGAVSPPSTSSWMEQDGLESSRSTSKRNDSLAFREFTGSRRGSYEPSMFIHDQSEDGHVSSLNIYDTSPGSPKAGSKRRASSPPRERTERSPLVSSCTIAHRQLPHRMSLQNMSSRTSPPLRLHPDHSSLSSASSAVEPRHGSLASSLGVSSAPSSATSVGSGGLSSCLSSPVQDSDTALAMSLSHDTTPKSYATQRQREAAEHGAGITRRPSQEIIHYARASSLSHILSGSYVCECCPKKPARFETKEDLKFHENEKQYTCAYCKKRFKNKNEAERHQNSVHLRRQSWCCAALSTVEAAFHASSSITYSADVCGYCGQEFANPPQWERRAEHLAHAHKFGECNQSKKFFRADHFRQHLKHSHHGTSGKWTNVLENECVKYESVRPEKRVSPVAMASTQQQQRDHSPPAQMITTNALGPGPPPRSARETIAETPHDS